MARIILVVTEFPRLSETFIVSKFLGLLDKGWDVHVVCSRSDLKEWGNFPEMDRRPEVRRRVHIGFPHRPRWLALLLLPLVLIRGLLIAPKASLRYFLNGWRIFKLDTLRRYYLDADLVRYQPDLIHFEFGALAPERMYLRELLGCKALVSFRGYDLNFVGLENPSHYQPVWQQADALHLLGEDLWKRALRRGCPSSKPHALIPPAIDTEYFIAPQRSNGEIIGTPERPLRILSVGRLEWKKGYEYAFQAVHLLKIQKMHFDYRVIGEGDYFEALAFTRHQLNLDEEISFLGAQPREVVREQMHWADVFLHAAVSEGFCNAVIEAQAMGLPVICSDADGLRENVLDGITGFVVPRRNPAALTEKLGILARDANLRLIFSQAGRQRTITLFNIQELVLRFQCLYADLCADLCADLDD